MPETESIAINTGPLLALIAGYGDLSLLKQIYKRVLVPFEVCREIDEGGTTAFVRGTGGYTLDRLISDRIFCNEKQLFLSKVNDN